MVVSPEEPWLLPEGVDELLPPRSGDIERLSRKLLDTYATWGYELVMPPLVEYLDALLTGTAGALGLRTFTLTDQLSGRLLGIRADITPQAARIDARRLRRDVPVRLCYLGTVLHTRADMAGESRCPLQIGAELFGHAGLESDVEVLALAIETLALAGLEQAHISLGHTELVRQLLARCGISAQQEQQLHGILQRKAGDELRSCLRDWSVPGREAKALAALMQLHGGLSVLADARRHLQHCGAEMLHCIDELEALVKQMEGLLDADRVHFELCEMHGYTYHNGIVFGAYLPGLGSAVLQGGRYDNVGRAFGRGRPATGFSTDAKLLVNQQPPEPDRCTALLAPWPAHDLNMQAEVTRRRRAGETVLYALPGQVQDPAAQGCNRELYRQQDGSWQVRPLD